MVVDFQKGFKNQLLCISKDYNMISCLYIEGKDKYNIKTLNNQLVRLLGGDEGAKIK